MSHKVRVIISDGIDGRVYHDQTLGGDGDYRVIPDLVDEAFARTRTYLAQVGSYALVHGYAYGAGAPSMGRFRGSSCRGHNRMSEPGPGILRWRQRRWWSWLVGRMYVLGIISSSIASSHEGGWIVHSLGWRGKRPYILGRQKRLWGRWPLFHRLRYGHWPETVWMGLCGVCSPWQCCGATGFYHKDGCDG